MSKGWWNGFKSYDWCAAIPSWSFFAPNPGRSDHHLMYRLCSGEGVWGSWLLVDLQSNKYWWQSIWNPVKRKNKALTDVSSDVVFFSKCYSKESVTITQSYLLLLNFLSGQALPENSDSIEFVIMESFGRYNSQQPEVIFESEVHPL